MDLGIPFLNKGIPDFSPLQDDDLSQKSGKEKNR